MDKCKVFSSDSEGNLKKQKQSQPELHTKKIEPQLSKCWLMQEYTHHLIPPWTSSVFNSAYQNALRRTLQHYFIVGAFLFSMWRLQSPISLSWADQCPLACRWDTGGTSAAWLQLHKPFPLVFLYLFSWQMSDSLHWSSESTDRHIGWSVCRMWSSRWGFISLLVFILAWCSVPPLQICCLTYWFFRCSLEVSLVYLLEYSVASSGCKLQGWQLVLFANVDCSLRHNSFVSDVSKLYGITQQSWE